MLSLNKIVSKSVAKLLKYRILFKDIFTFLGIDYRDASLIIFYLVVIGINTPKSDEKDNYIIQKVVVKKV